MYYLEVCNIRRSCCISSSSCDQVFDGWHVDTVISVWMDINISAVSESHIIFPYLVNHRRSPIQTSLLFFYPFLSLLNTARLQSLPLSCLWNYNVIHFNYQGSRKSLQYKENHQSYTRKLICGAILFCLRTWNSRLNSIFSFQIFHSFYSFLIIGL